MRMIVIDGRAAVCADNAQISTLENYCRTKTQL